MNMRPTISDVAKAAGVSPSTASVVFSGKVRVSDETADKVRTAAEKLGYFGPDPRAASFRRGRSGIVGVALLAPLRLAFLDPILVTTMDGIAEGLSESEAGILLLRDHDETVSITDAPVDGMIFLGTRDRSEEQAKILKSRGVPSVNVEGTMASAPRVGLDNVSAQRTVAEHVASRGHSDVAIVTLSWGIDARADGPAAPITRDRLNGARAIFPDAPAFQARASSIDAGFAAANELLAFHQPTAIIAQSDLLAVGVIRAVEAAGLRVPEDISVTGFDGIPIDGIAPRKLTTVVQPAFEKGQRAAEAMTALLAGKPFDSVVIDTVFRSGNTVADVAGA